MADGTKADPRRWLRVADIRQRGGHWEVVYEVTDSPNGVVKDGVEIDGDEGQFERVYYDEYSVRGPYYDREGGDADGIKARRDENRDGVCGAQGGGGQQDDNGRGKNGKAD